MVTKMVTQSSFLTSEQTRRYRAHIVLPSVGGKGQQDICAAKIVLIGGGGVGCPLLLTLAAAGIGHITLIDSDSVALDNLQRQILYHENDIGKSKAIQAVAHLQNLNSRINYVAITDRLSQENALSLLKGYDVILDTTDNLATRLLISDAAYFLKTPIITAAATAYDILLMSLRPYDIDPTTQNPFPSLRCLYNNRTSRPQIENCNTLGILTSVSATAGTLQAHETLHYITQGDFCYDASLLLMDMRDMRFETIKRHYDPDNALTGLTPRITQDSLGNTSC